MFTILFSDFVAVVMFAKKFSRDDCRLYAAERVAVKLERVVLWTIQ